MQQSQQSSGPPATRPGRRSSSSRTLKTPAFATVSSEVRKAIKLNPHPAEIFLHHRQRKTSKQFCQQTIFGSVLERPSSHPPANWHSTKAPPRCCIAQSRRNAKNAWFANWKNTHSSYFAFPNITAQRNFGTTSITNKPKIGTNTQLHRDRLSREVIGEFHKPDIPLNPHSRKNSRNRKMDGIRGHARHMERCVCLGVLTPPQRHKPNERRPVVVCQHGLEGLPMDTITRDQQSRAFLAYKGFAAELADRGFIVFAPHNPYRGRDAFRALQRKANPLGKSLFNYCSAAQPHSRLARISTLCRSQADWFLRFVLRRKIRHAHSSSRAAILPFYLFSRF